MATKKGSQLDAGVKATRTWRGEFFERKKAEGKGTCNGACVDRDLKSVDQWSDFVRFWAQRMYTPNFIRGYVSVNQVGYRNPGKAASQTNVCVRIFSALHHEAGDAHSPSQESADYADAYFPCS